MANMNTQYHYRQVPVEMNPWLTECCWSCMHSDVTYDLKSLECKRLAMKITMNSLCSLYRFNARNPYHSKNSIS